MYTRTRARAHTHTGEADELAKALVECGADKTASREEFPEFTFLDGPNVQVGAEEDVDGGVDGGDSLLEPMDSAEHSKAALKIQNRARVKNAEKRTAQLKAEGKLPGQLRAKKIEEWGTAIFKNFDANSDGRLSSKELAAALKDLPKTKPKKVPPGTKFQSVEDMMNAMDSDESGSLDLAEWLANLGECPGLAAALAENVTVGEGGEEIAVTAEEIKEVGDAEKAAVKIQSIARGKRDRARVAGIKGAGGEGGAAETAEAAADSEPAAADS
jgi:hypothetical protein